MGWSDALARREGARGDGDVTGAVRRSPPGKWAFLHDRLVEAGGRGISVRLALPAGPGRPAHDVVLAIRFARVEVARPVQGRREGLPATVAVHVVDARGVDPPATGGVHRRLITTHAVETLSGALLMVSFYRQRYGVRHRGGMLGRASP